VVDDCGSVVCAPPVVDCAPPLAVCESPVEVGETPADVCEAPLDVCVEAGGSGSAGGACDPALPV
jgi:hypothetical protein